MKGRGDRQRRWWRRLALGLVAVAPCVGLASPAAAELDGACVATGTFTAGTTTRGPFTVDPAVLGSGDVLVVPRADTVHWEAAVSGSPPAGAAAAVAPRPIAGEVVVDLPWPLGQVVVGSWDTDSGATAGAGDERYDLPGVVPGGVVFKVSGRHLENGEVHCSGSVLVEVEGGPFDSPLLPGSLALTALAGGLVAWTGVRSGPGAAVRP